MVLSLTDARAAAKQVIALINTFCERVEIAGSIRRGKENPKDAELVIIPTPQLLSHLDKLVTQGHLKKALYGANKTTRWGTNYRGVDVDGVKVEMFMADAENWGYIYWLRTGPGDANTHVMKWRSFTQKTATWYAKDGYIHDSATGERIVIADEQAMFSVLGTAYLEPHQRTLERYQQIFKRGHKWGDVSKLPRVGKGLFGEQSVPGRMSADEDYLARADLTDAFVRMNIQFIARRLRDSVAELEAERASTLSDLPRLQRLLELYTHYDDKARSIAGF